MYVVWCVWLRCTLYLYLHVHVGTWSCVVNYVYNLCNHAVSSFIELVKDIFKIPGVKLFLSGHINQDPVEKHFGRLRQQGRANQNPTVAEALKSTQTLRVIDSVWIDDITGNCRGRRKKKKFAEAEDSQPLPKRRRRRPSI